MTSKERSDNEWVEELSSTGATQTSALEDLRIILKGGLLRALPGTIQGVRKEFESNIDDFIQETLVLVLRHLDTYQGRSKFTTWVYKIAIRTVFSELRRRRWKDVFLEEEMKSGQASPEELA